MNKIKLFAAVVLFIAPFIGWAQSADPIYKNKNAPIETRIKDLLSRMTLEEKLRQIDIWHPKTDVSKPGELNKVLTALGDTIKNGIGFLQFNVLMKYVDYQPQFNAVQKYLVTQTRLGIPAISNAEGCHGFVGNQDQSTVFPVAALLGSTWDTTLIEAVYTAVAKEMRSYGTTHAATPVIDLLRDPRFGRADEMLGEDPYHVAQMGVAAIFGLQGRTLLIDTNHLIACAKHFSGHGQPEGGTNLAPANLSERVLRENHFYPFEMAVKKANVRTVMASYNEIDGVPNHANKWLLNDVLRGEWGFTGYVISDYDAVNRMVSRQHASVNQAEAGMKAINAGMDFECPSSWKDYCFRFLPAFVKDGAVKEATIDSAVARVLRNKFMMGLFEQPYLPAINENEKRKEQFRHRQIALEAAEKGMILLKNENNTLPFNDTKIKRLAVIGPNADEVHYGTYSNDSTKGISIIEGLRNYGKGKFEVVYAEGFKIYENDNTIKAADRTPAAENKRIAEAVALAKSCDAVLLVMGGNELTCREEWKGHTGDRVDLDLLGRQNDLAKAIFNLKKQTAVLLINGRPLSVNYLAEKAPAMIEGWYLGQEQGTAVANVIFGKVNPSGKLAVTIPRHVGQLPVYYNHKPYVHESPYITGEYSPLFPFGFGLSYTQYKYSNLKIDRKKVKAGEPVKVTIDVTNTGDRDGDEIVQVYIRDIVSTVTRPVQELKDFARIHFNKGETKNISFLITPDKLQYYGQDMKRIIEPGEFEVQVGKSSTNYLSQKFEVVADTLKMGVAVTTKRLMELAQPVFAAENTSIKIIAAIDQTGNVVDNVITDKADVALTTRNLKDFEIKKSPTVMGTPIGLDGLVLAVSNSVPVNSLSFEQITGIWTGTYTNWAQVGGPNLPIVAIGRAKAYDPIQLFADFMKLDTKPVDEGITYSEKEKALWSKAVAAPSTDDAALALLQQTAGAITYFPLQIFNNYQNKGYQIKTLQFNGVQATVETIASGEYFIHRRLNVMTNGKPAGAAKLFVDFMLSGKGQQLIKEAGFLQLQ